MFLSGPAIRADGLRALQHAAHLIEAARATNWAAAKALLPADMPPPANLERLTTFISTMWSPTASAQISHWQTIAARRMAAVALGVRLYELDRSGRPDGLEELVPDYLPAIPLDPFASDGRGIGYRPKGDPPVLYSVGVNGIDEKGAFALHLGGGINYTGGDLVLFLGGDRDVHARAAPPASRPSGPSVEARADQPEAGEDGRDADDRHTTDQNRQDRKSNGEGGHGDGPAAR